MVYEKTTKPFNTCQKKKRTKQKGTKERTHGVKYRKTKVTRRGLGVKENVRQKFVINFEFSSL